MAQTPPAVTLPEPEMLGPLAFSPQPPRLDTGALGTWYVDGVLSGLGLVQSHPVSDDRSALADIGNGQVFIQKIDGVVQFYAQLGAYAIPQLGTQYGHLADAGDTAHNYFGWLPQAYLKIAPSDNLSIQAGKLPTLIGPEDTFTFQNFNVVRGLLWNQEPSVSRGMQANLTLGPVAFSLSLNDGYYANRYTWLSGEANWTISPADALMLEAGANLGSTRGTSIATPLAQNNSAIWDLVYTHHGRRLTATPYLQYSHVRTDPGIGIPHGTSSYGAALLLRYAVTARFQLGARAEYIRQEGGASLIYGTGSGAASATVTPAFVYHQYFARVEGSVVEIAHVTPGDGFGQGGFRRTQFRGILETGLLF